MHSRFDLDLRFVNNDEVHKPNGTSLLKAKAFVTEPTFLLMSDHLWSPDLLQRVRRFPLAHDEAVLGVDFKISECFDLDDATKVGFAAIAWSASARAAALRCARYRHVSHHAGRDRGARARRWSERLFAVAGHGGARANRPHACGRRRRRGVGRRRHAAALMPCREVLRRARTAPAALFGAPTKWSPPKASLKAVVARPRARVRQRHFLLRSVARDSERVLREVRCFARPRDGVLVAVAAWLQIAWARATPRREVLGSCLGGPPVGSTFFCLFFGLWGRGDLPRSRMPSFCRKNEQQSALGEITSSREPRVRSTWRRAGRCAFFHRARLGPAGADRAPGRRREVRRGCVASRLPTGQPRSLHCARRCRRPGPRRRISPRGWLARPRSAAVLANRLRAVCGATVRVQAHAPADGRRRFRACCSASTVTRSRSSRMGQVFLVPTKRSPKPISSIAFEDYSCERKRVGAKGAVR